MWKYVSAKFLCLCFACFALCGVGVGFSLYSDFRSEEFGFDIATLLIGIGIACLLPALVVLPPLLLASALVAREYGTEWRSVWRRNRLILFALLVGVFEGSLCAECYAVLDEGAFKIEVTRHRSGYKRDRKGVGGGSLWYSPKNGFSATSYSVADLSEGDG